jgi:hypothetical protein
MKYDLRQILRRTRNPRRSVIVFRQIVAPAVLAGDLYIAGYRPVVDAWLAALPGITAQYERTLSEIITDSPAEVGATISAVEGDIARLLLTIRLRLERWALRVEGYQRGKWRSAVLTATGVDIETLVGANDARMTMGAAIERNVALVRSVSDQTRDRISEEVFQGLRERKPAREVARGIREKVDMGRRRALNIASDQTVKLTAALNDERRREAGLSTWEWVSSHKLHFRPEHAKRDGKRYDDEAKSGPHKPPKDRPAELPYCGCTSRAVLTLDGEF